MSFFAEAREWVREVFTRSRLAYGVGILVSGAMGHCVAIASVAPRVAELDAEVEAIREHIGLDRRVLDRVEGINEAIAAALGVEIPPPVPRVALPARRSLWGLWHEVATTPHAPDSAP